MACDHPCASGNDLGFEEWFLSVYLRGSSF